MAYCTTDDLVALGYTWDATADGPSMAAICDTASQLVDAYCRQTFLQATITETHAVRVRCGQMKIFPLNLTVSTVGAISFVSVCPVPFSTSNPMYVPGLGYVLAATNAPDGHYLVNMTYTFGFLAGSFPADLVKATVLATAPLIDDYFLSKDSNVSMVKSIKQGELRIERQDTDDIPKDAKIILDKKYVRVRPG